MTRILQIKSSQLSAEGLVLKSKAINESSFLAKLISKQAESTSRITEANKSPYIQEAIKTITFFKKLQAELKGEIKIVQKNLEGLSKAIKITEIKKERIEEKEKEIKILKKTREDDEKIEEIQGIAPLVAKKAVEPSVKQDQKPHIEDKPLMPTNITLTVTRADGVQAHVSIKPTEVSVKTELSSESEEQDLRNRLKRAAKGEAVKLNERIC